MRPTSNRPRFLLAALLTGLGVAAPAFAQKPAATEVCIAVDEAHDTLAPADRTAARLLIGKQFEIAGWRVVPDGCSNAYLVSHVKLGYTISVVLTGPAGRREGTARGLDDLIPLYSQMVRSIVSGRPMEGMNVVDRTNVTAAQDAPPKRVSSDSFGYARLGAGNRGAGMGFGHRAELDSVAIDVSFLNFTHEIGTSSSYSYGYSGGGGSMMWSWIKLEGLHFLNRKANSSLYFGGGASWGGGYVPDPNPKTFRSWTGSGLQGELTAGYEFGRASTMRVFVQADATLPFYQMVANGGSSLYAPSFTISVGLGWQRSRR
jgi:hypothetical protein